jgi:DNA-binding MarR family transcriptional regulator
VSGETDGVVRKPSDQVGPGDPAAAVLAVARLARHLEQAAGELPISQYRLLALIDAGDQQASRIAAKLVTGRPAVSAGVDSLCRKGLVRKSAVAGDQRAAALELTAAGREQLRAATGAMVAKLDELLSTVADSAGLILALVALGEVIEADSVERARGLR